MVPLHVSSRNSSSGIFSNSKKSLPAFDRLVPKCQNPGVPLKGTRFESEVVSNRLRRVEMDDYCCVVLVSHYISMVNVVITVPKRMKVFDAFSYMFKVLPFV